MSIADALTLFFEAEPRWNDRHKRFENELGGRMLYWAWKQPSEEVVVITCFERE